MSIPIVETMPPDSTPPPPQEICLQVGDKILYKQTIVPAPPSPTFPPLTTTSPVPAEKHGENILVLIPTANQFKKKAIQAKIEARLEKEGQSRLVILQQNVESGVGHQPYDDNGLEGAYTRISNALIFFQHHPEILEKNKIGTVLVGAIENYIKRSTTGPAVDYGIVVIFNATTQRVWGTVSRGVTVPKGVLEEAEGMGFEDEGRRSGKVTIGEMLAKNFGVDKADWHKVVSGVSRYVLLEEALDRVDVEI